MMLPTLPLPPPRGSRSSLLLSSKVLAMRCASVAPKPIARATTLI
jgi:hypothetical protein